MEKMNLTSEQIQELVKLVDEQVAAMDEAGLIWDWALGHWSERSGLLPLCHDGLDY